MLQLRFKQKIILNDLSQCREGVMFIAMKANRFIIVIVTVKSTDSLRSLKFILKETFFPHLREESLHLSRKQYLKEDTSSYESIWNRSIIPGIRRIL